MDMHIYLHMAEDAAVSRLERIERMLEQIIKGENILMALDQALAKRLDDATNAVAARLKKIQDDLDAAGKAGGLTADQANALAASIEPDIAKLEAMGKDPANPVPPTA